MVRVGTDYFEILDEDGRVISRSMIYGSAAFPVAIKHVRVNSMSISDIEKMKQTLGVSEAEFQANAAVRRRGGSPVVHAAEKARTAPGPRNSFRPTEGTSDPYAPGPAEGGGAKYGVRDRQSSPFPDGEDADLGDPNKHVDAALNLIAKHGDDEDGADHLERAARHLQRAAEMRRPKPGSQHFRRR